MLLHVISFLTIDPSLGRIDRSMLSDQVRMELLFEGMRFAFKGGIQDKNGDFKEISEWHSIECAGGRVTRIKLIRQSFNGLHEQFSFEFIPPQLTEFSAIFSNLHGTLDTSILPLDLVLFIVKKNKLHGSIILRSFPQKLQKINISMNDFCRSLDLSCLPASTQVFDARQNVFSGEISLNYVPPMIEELWLDHNKLKGPILSKTLPNSLTHLSLHKNELNGNFQLRTIAPYLQYLSLWDNKWDGKGTLVFPRCVDQSKITFKTFTHCIAVVDEEGKPHPWEGQILQIQRNHDRF